MTDEGSAATVQLDWLPQNASLIAIVRETDCGEWAAGVAVGLADIVGRTRGRTYLANAGTDGSELDSVLNVEGGPGLASALSGATTVASIARSAPERSFAYLPAGDSCLPLSDLRRVPTFRRLLRKMRAGGGTLLLYSSQEDLKAASGGDASESLGLDGCISLGTIPDLALDIGAPLLARVERPVEAPSPRQAGIDEDVPTGRQDALSGSTRPGSLLNVLVPIIGLGLLWAVWVVAHPAVETEARSQVPAVDAVPAESESVETVPVDIEPVPPAWTAPDANYSVLVGSYIRLTDAEERRSLLARNAGLFYVSPTPVRERVYYRVFAGVHEDRVDALSAMESLVADGDKKVAKLWDVRPVRLAYDLGTFDSLDGAGERVEALGTDGIPAYVLRDLAEPPSFRVFAGAFESDEAAIAMGEMLALHGLEVELNTRSGVAP